MCSLHTYIILKAVIKSNIPMIFRNFVPRLLLMIGGFLLFASIGLNIQLSKTLFGYYRQLNATRLAPLNLSQYPHHEMIDASQPTVLFLGDSRAAAWPFPADLPQFHFINRGIGAQTSAQVQLRYTVHVESLNPDILVLQVGINDLKTIPLFPEHKIGIIEASQQHITTIVDRAIDQDTTVILTTIFPVGEVPLARRFVWSPEVAEAVRTVNRYLHTLASEQIVIFDSYDLLVDESTGLIKPEYAADELHLNQHGYDHLNEALTATLLAVEHNRD